MCQLKHLTARNREVMQCKLWTQLFQQNFFSDLDFKTIIYRLLLTTRILQVVLPKQVRILWQLIYLTIRTIVI